MKNVEKIVFFGIFQNKYGKKVKNDANGSDIDGKGQN